VHTRAATDVRCGRCPIGGRHWAQEGVAPCPRNGGCTSKRMMLLQCGNAVLAAGAVLRRPCCVGVTDQKVSSSASGVTNIAKVSITGVALVAGGDTATSCVYATFIQCVSLCDRVCHYVHSLYVHCMADDTRSGSADSAAAL
jgi:hypothetical protein